MDERIKVAVEEYQRPGCVCGHDISCYQKEGDEACSKHVPGTTMSHIGRFFLGMPKGFNRLGPDREMRIYIFPELKDGWGYDIFNVPVWKHKDKNGNVIVRGISPRINAPFLHIFLSGCLSEINCVEITDKELEEMD